MINANLVLSVFVLVLAMPLVGCMSTASQSSQEFIRDPLGIDRAIEEYYFPNGRPITDDLIETVDDSPDPFGS